MRVGDYLVEDVIACVGRHGDVYCGKFKKLHDGGYSFNWCSALFGGLWFAYRKMWKAAAAILAFNVLYSLASSLVASRTVLATGGSMMVFMAVCVVLLAVFIMGFGLLGDWLYCHRVTKILDGHGCRMRQPSQDEGLRQALAKEGGTSIWGPLVFCTVGLVAEQILSVILGAVS